MNNFIKLCKTTDIPINKGIKFTFKNDCEIAVFNNNGKFFAFDNLCPHNHTPKIFEGFIKNDFVICPVHLYRFNIYTGKSEDNIGGKLKIYELKVENEDIFINLPENKLFDFS